MKTTLSSSFLLALLVLLLIPDRAAAQDKPRYFAAKAGAYVPTGDLDYLEYDDGFSGEVSVGFIPARFLAVEGSAGIFHAERDVRNCGQILCVRIHEEITVIPVTATVKFGRFDSWGDVYGGLGLGAYFAGLDSEWSFDSNVEGSFSDDDVVLGVHATAGADFNLTDVLFLGFQGTYHVTDEAKFTGSPFGMGEWNLNGFTLTTAVGFRF